MKRNVKVLFSVAAVIVLATIAAVIGIYTGITNTIVEKKTLDTIGELATHDRNTIAMFIEYNWKNLERIGSRLKRDADGLESRRSVNEFLSNEANTSTFDKVFLLLDDGSYYTDIAYYEREAVDYFDYAAIFGDGKDKNVMLANLPTMREDKVVVYGCKLKESLAGIAVESGRKEVYAVIGVAKRTTIKDGLIIESFADEQGNVRGHSSVIDAKGNYIVNRDDDASFESYNWFEHIDKCEHSEMTSEQVENNLQEGKTFWFYHKDGKVRELNYCVPLGHVSDWYFLLTVNDDALSEQSNPLVLMIVIALGIVVLITIAAMITVMVALNNSAKAHAQEKVQGEFLANMSHEMRTPLNGIVGLNYLMITSIDDPEKKAQVKEWLSKSHATAKYLLSLINDVLDVSKLRSGKVDIVAEPLLIESVLDAIYSMQCDNIKSREITYRTDVEIEVPWILGDEVRIKQVLMNIISNAAKFTPAGGTITLSVRQQKTDDSHVTTTFVCQDTGCGMSKEFQAKIFDAFTQDRNSSRNSTKGTGLGMAISKMLVNAMGGDITVESELDKGSKFTVTIPSRISDLPDYVDRTVDEETERLADEYAAENMPLKILVAEDNELNAEILIEILESSGFTAVHAEDGERTLRLFEQSEVGEYGLILMDMRMPVMDGCEASKAIRALDRPDARTIPIFACTANTFKEDRIKAYDSGMNDFLTKPIDIKVLLQKMEHLGRAKKSGNGEEKSV